MPGAYPPQVLQEFYVVTTCKLQAPLSPEVARHA